MIRCSWLLTLVVAPALIGCAVPQAQNTEQWQKMEIDPATGAGYYLFVPKEYNPAKPAPLIITCHGTPPFDVAEHHIREWKMLAKKNGCIAIAPQLVGTDGIFGDGPVAAMLHNERVILSLISMVGYRYNVDTANVMITGFSGGGFPVYWVGLRNPNVFSCVVPRSCNFSEYNLDGWYPPEAKTEPDVYVYYGEHDPLTIKVQSDNGIRYLKNRNFRVWDYVVPGIGHERRPDVAMKFFREHWRAARPSQPGLR